MQDLSGKSVSNVTVTDQYVFSYGLSDLLMFKFQVLSNCLVDNIYTAKCFK